MDKTEKSFIGIDPGVETGFAIWNSTLKEFRLIETLTFWGVIKELEACIKIDKFYGVTRDLTIVLEDPNLNKPVWLRPGQDARKHVKIAQDVGKNKRDAHLLHEWCIAHGFVVKLIQPSGKGMSKMKPEAFKNLTGWNHRTSQHGRDAAMMVFGM